MSIMEKAREYLEQVKDLAREARREIYDTLPKEVQVEAHRIQKASFFVPENAQLGSRVEHLSPSGTYKLVVTPYATSPGSWNYSQGVVYRKGDDMPIAEIQRNYGSFPFAWLEGHRKGDFLIGGEDYQGQTVIDLRTGARRDILPTSAEQGCGFCWAAIHPSPTGKLVAVEGCFWGAPYELRFYDFSEPMLPPWPLIASTGGLDEFFAWIDDEHANIGGHEDVYTPLGKSENDLYLAQKRGEITEDDHDRFRDDTENWKEHEVNERVWVRPSPLQSLEDYVNEYVPWRRAQDQRVYPELNHNTRSLLAQLSDEERTAYEKGPIKEFVEWAFTHEEGA